MSIRNALLAAFALAVVTGAAPAQEGRDRVAGYRERVECMNHLRQIGGLLAAQRAADKAKPFPGPAYLLQVAPRVTDARLGVFVCPGDFQGGHDVKSADFRKRYRDNWMTAPCSYRGPDAERLSQFAEQPHKPVILACDANGPDGKTPQHPDGVCVLWSNHRVEFLTWEEIDGSDGKPCAVGPESPDPRLRHLVLQSDVAGSGRQIANDETTPQEGGPLREELDRLRAEHEKALAELREEVERLGKEVVRLKELMEQNTGKPSRPEPPSTPRVDALVTSVDSETGLVHLSVGSDQGARKGMEFTVYRGNQYVGKVIVNEVKPNLCTAIPVKELERMTIRTGDKATTRF